MQSTQVASKQTDAEQIAQGAAAEHAPVSDAHLDKVDWVGAIPYLLIHLACIAVIWVGVSPIAVTMAVVTRNPCGAP